MTASDGPPMLHIPARDIPIPSSVSPQAQALMATPLLVGQPYPPPDDHAAWRAYAKTMDAAITQFLRAMPSDPDATVDELKVGDARAFIVKPGNLKADENRVWLLLHGGGLVLGGGDACRECGLAAAARTQVTVCAVDYRLPPDFPYPAALDDCVAIYRALLRDHRPEEILVEGGSAGGNLAAAFILRARDEGLPLPAAAIMITPELDLTESGDSFQTNLGLDNALRESLMPANLLYAGGHDLADPYLSPLFGDFSKGFPPTLLTAGSRDLFLSNAIRMHWRLLEQRVPVELYILEAASHGGFPGAPEDELLQAQIRRFLDTHWPPRGSESANVQ